MNRSATLTAPLAGRLGPGKLAFARHFGEMLLVMFVGMGILGGLASLIFASAGSGLSGQPDALRVAMMGAYMTVPMAAWMSYRGHAVERNVEMAASMVVPTALAAVLASMGVFGIETAMGVQHGVMVPAMLGVMLWRYDEYARRH